MNDALWNTAEHAGWQIIHAYCDAQGAQRKFTSRIRPKNINADAKFDISFRDIPRQDDENIGSDYGNLRI